jgi:DNA polymerase III delta prime subunit
MEIENKLFVYKFQPVFFTDYEIEEELIETLQILMSINNINLLLIGDISSGKTSLLNSIISEYYTGYSRKEYKENILYINSLKEQGINYYRSDVKTFCQTCSVIKNKKKFIVLDDIDLINEQSQQVFRNYIDKYSHNVHFISSCNNVQKVIESLQSRFTIIRIKSLDKEKLMNLINKIKTSENIDMEPCVEEFIINISNNNIKIIINYMEKFKLYGDKITLNIAKKLCCNISFLIFEEYTKCIINKDLKQAIDIIYNVFDKGYSVMDILDNYFIFIKNTNSLNEIQKYEILPLICKYITIFYNVHEDEIELALFTNNLINVYNKI